MKQAVTAKKAKSKKKERRSATVLREATLGAVLEGDAQAVAAWLDEGGSVDARCAKRHGLTLLLAAAMAGQEAMVRMLLQRGANVNLLQNNPEGLTALMNAAIGGHTRIVQVLLDAKADASLQESNGRTALMWAKQEKRVATAQLLRQHAKRQAAEETVMQERGL